MKTRQKVVSLFPDNFQIPLLIMWKLCVYQIFVVLKGVFIGVGVLRKASLLQGTHNQKKKSFICFLRC